MTLKRIQVILRDAGIASRRKAEELILEGRVTINGHVVSDMGVKADPEQDHIKVNGKLLRPPEATKLYYLFNKPRNVVSTISDPEERPCLGDVLKALRKSVFPVGRLDFDAEGLMILTNDGDLAQKLAHPSNRTPRTYLVKVKGVPDDKILGTIKKGMSIGEGDRVGDVEVTVIQRQKTTTWLRVTLYEGKKNELKRIFFHIRHPVRKLRRTGFGPFILGDLPMGSWRPLTAGEMAKVDALLGTLRSPASAPPSRQKKS